MRDLLPGVSDGFMSRRIASLALIVVPLVWSVPCHAAATYDATGLWFISHVVEVSIPGQPTYTVLLSESWDITQTSETPDDAFIFYRE